MKFWNRIQLKTKLLFSYLALSILPILLLGSFLTKTTCDIAYKKAVQLLDSSVEQLCGNYAALAGSVCDIIDGLYASPPLQSYLQSRFTDGYAALMEYQAKAAPVLNQFLLSHGSLDVRIYTDNPTLRYSGETNNRLDALARQNWYGSPGVGGFVWAPSSRLEGRPGRQYVCCYRGYADPGGAPALKTLIAVFVPEESFFSFIREEGASGKLIFLRDGQGRVLTSTDRGPASAELAALPAGASAEGQLCVYREKTYVLLQKELRDPRLGASGWTLTCLVPYGDLQRDLAGLSRSGLLLSGIILLAAGAAIFWISHSITARIARLTDKIARVDAQNFLPAEPIGGDDEIARLGRRFDGMVERLGALIHTVYESKIQIQKAQILNQQISMEKKQAELLALQAQINPHYLFNMLDTLRMNLVLKDDRETAAIVKKLADNLRSYISSSDGQCTIGQSYQAVLDFLQLQRYRLGNRLHFDAYIDQALWDCPVPKLLLQPLVENAVFHGVEPKGGEGTILLEVFQVDAVLHIKVTDDGVGIPPAALRQLRADLEESPFSPRQGARNIALRNLNRRVRLLYGEAYGLTLASRPGAGAEAELLLPCKPSGKEAPDVPGADC